ANSLSGGSVVTLRPSSSSTSIGIGGAAGTLQLSTTDLAALADGYAGIVIGHDGGSHVITVGISTFRDPLTLNGQAVVLDGPLMANDGVTVEADTTTFNAGIAASDGAI